MKGYIIVQNCDSNWNIQQIMVKKIDLDFSKEIMIK